MGGLVFRLQNTCQMSDEYLKVLFDAYGHINLEPTSLLFSEDKQILHNSQQTVNSIILITTPLGLTSPV